MHAVTITDGKSGEVTVLYLGAYNDCHYWAKQIWDRRSIGVNPSVRKARAGDTADDDLFCFATQGIMEPATQGKAKPGPSDADVDAACKTLEREMNSPAFQKAFAEAEGEGS